MLLWDGDLLNFHFGDSNHSLSNWGVSFGHNVGVSSGLQTILPDPFASEGLNGHWALDNLMPVLSAEHLIDADSSANLVVSGGLSGTVDSPAHHDFSSGFILPSVLKVEEPFAMPLPVDTIASQGTDGIVDFTEGLQSSDLMAAKPQWTIAMRMAMRH